jgi:uncharacterized membrane protein YqgA involved in biofilm formation
MKSGNIIIPLLAVAFGVIIGEQLDLDGQLKRFGGLIEARVNRDVVESEDEAAKARIRFITGFVTATLVFEIGPLAIIGPIQNGINAGDVQLLVVKSTLDFFAAMAFAASLGLGVAFSVLPMAVVQGGFSFVGIGMAGLFSASTTGLSANNPYIVELTATGGLILIGLSLILLSLKPLRVANYLPALLLAPLLVLLAQISHLGIPL